MSSATRRANATLGLRSRAVQAAVALVAALAISGCAWSEQYRAARPRETLELESFTLTVPEEPGWKVTRHRDAAGRTLQLAHSTGGVVDRFVVVSERTDDRVPSAREALLAGARAELLKLVGDASAQVTEVPAPLDPRFGPTAVQLLVRGEEGDVSAGLLVKRVASLATLHFVPPAAPDRLCIVSYVEAARRGATAAELEERWRALLADVTLRPVDAEAVHAAARGAFPKTLKPGLARRSLTLPQAGLRIGWSAERWTTGRGEWDDALALAIGLSDRLQLDLPGVLSYALGDPEALTAPEVALGGGLTRIGFWSEGYVWGAGLTARARKRFGAGLAAVAGGFLERSHDADGDHLYGGGAAGAVWSFRDVLSLGLEAGWSSYDGQPSPRLAWIGGRTTPLVSVHLPPLDLGLTGGVGWDVDGVGLLAGFALALTF